jgi:TATA-box binding protein (TBP) (component of TFIID and TFIIIB)
MMVRKVLAFGLVSAITALANAQIVTNLEQGGKLYWKFNSGRYDITGALTESGSISASNPLEFPLQDLNNDGRKLDVELRVQDLFPNLGINYTLNLIGTVVSQNPNEAIIRWEADVNPNQCITVQLNNANIQVLITRLAGALQARVTPIQCQTNPYDANWQKVTLRLDDNDGDANNFLRLEGYLFCPDEPTDALFATAVINTMDWESYAGGFTGVFGNVNGDGIVDDADLLQVLFNFGSDDAATDTNGDGIVDDADLLTVLFNFGAEC